jgi:hypothetical protein
MALGSGGFTGTIIQNLLLTQSVGNTNSSYSFCLKRVLFVAHSLISRFSIPPDPSFFTKAISTIYEKMPPNPRGSCSTRWSRLGQLAEAFVVGSQYAKALGYGPGTRLCFRSRWSSLRGRTLTNWGNEEYDYWWAKECRDDEVQVDFTLPIDAPNQELIGEAAEAIQQLMRAFAGYIISEAIIQKEATRQLDRA